MNTKKCPQCGKETEPDSRYCSWCGTELPDSRGEEGNESPSGGRKISIKWIFISAAIIFVAEFIFAFLAAFIYSAFISSSEMTFETLVIIASIGSTAGIFCGSLVAAWRSPGVTIKEPAIGAAAIVILSRLFDIIITGSFTLFSIAGIIVAFAIALAGAWLGEKLQKSGSR